MSTNKKPVFGVQEWADESANCCSGCSHDCHYCYAKANAARFKRVKPEDWHNEFPEELTRIKKLCKKPPCKVMFPTRHDISLANLDGCMEAIERLLYAGHELLIVSKPHVQCIAKIVDTFQDRKDQIMFRFSIGSPWHDTLAFWEPGAPSFAERFIALQYTFQKGYKAGVSCEPMLDSDATTLIARIKPYVTDSIWLGLPNNLKARLTLNNAPKEIKERGKMLLEALSDRCVKVLYSRHKRDPMIKWKESIKKIVGLEVATEAGTDK